MKQLSNDLKNSISNNSICLVKCYNMFLSNGEKFYFTDFSKNILYNNIEYLANNALQNDKINSNLDLDIQNNTMKGFIDNDLIKHDDILSGKFDNAELEIFLLDIKTNEKMSIFNGFIGSISHENSIFIADIRDKSLLLEKTIGETYSPLCRCSFCDLKCGLDKKYYTITGTISEIINQLEFNTSILEITNKENNYFTNGTIKMTNGKNKDLVTEIKRSENEKITLKFKFPFNINVGDQFEITAGCDKEFSTCYSKFNNALNFRGEPNLPRSEKIFKIY